MREECAYKDQMRFFPFLQVPLGNNFFWKRGTVHRSLFPNPLPASGSQDPRSARGTVRTPSPRTWGAAVSERRGCRTPCHFTPGLWSSSPRPPLRTWTGMSWAPRVVPASLPPPSAPPPLSSGSRAGAGLCTPSAASHRFLSAPQIGEGRGGPGGHWSLRPP